jgi:hypothetical protein
VRIPTPRVPTGSTGVVVEVVVDGATVVDEEVGGAVPVA